MKNQDRMTILRLRQEYLIANIKSIARRQMTAAEAVCKEMLTDWADELSIEIRDLQEEVELDELAKELDI